MRRTWVFVAATLVCSVVLGSIGCGGSVTTTTVQPTTTTQMDAKARFLATATPISWDELMAGGEPKGLRTVRGTIGEGGLGTGGGSLQVGGDPKHLLVFEPLDMSSDTALPPISMADFHLGEVTFYGSATGTPGIESADGSAMVIKFFVVLVDYGSASAEPESAVATTVVSDEPSSFSDGVYLVGTDLPAGTYKGVTKGSSGYWKISSDANGSDIIENDITEGQFYLDVRDGQYLELSDVTITKVE